MNYSVLALIITNIIWGAAAPIFKLALTNIPPFTLAFWRFFVAALILLPGAFVSWKKVNRPDFLTICGAAFFGIVINISFYFLGLQQGVSINAPVIASAGPVFLFFLSAKFLHERLHFKVFSGMMLSLVGVMVIILSPILIDGRDLVGAEMLANLLFVIAMMGAVLDPLIAKRALGRVSALQFVFIAFSFAALAFFPLAAWEMNSWSFSQLNLSGLTGIIYGVFLSSLTAYALFYWGISKIQAQEVGIFTYIDPVAALIIAGPLLGEYPTIYYWLGAILVFLGIFVAEGRLHWHPLHKLKK